VHNANISVNDLVQSIEVFDCLKHKYSNDENIDIDIEILRNEICQMFGGTIFKIIREKAHFVVICVCFVYVCPLDSCLKGFL
jgi:hypothetical protein